MKVTYTGMNAELAPAQRAKLEAKFAKLGKLIDRKGEKEARVILTSERHLTHAEITVQYYDHQIAGFGSDPDLVTAISDAVEKLEKQILKQQTKWRDNKRSAPAEWEEEVVEPSEPGEKRVAASVQTEGETEQHVFRVDHHERRKPMTIEEALMTIGKDRDYLVYRDAETDRLSVLIRRRDGHFDLVEA